MPSSIYGINDNFDIGHSHVIPAMIVKMHAAKMAGKPFVELWGTGAPLREFLYVDDLADACVFMMERYEENRPINIGTGKDISIMNLAGKIKEIVGFEGEIIFDTSKPDGTYRKVLDITRLEIMGWKPKVDFEEGIRRSYDDYLNKLG